MTCTNCEKHNEPESNYCAECGAPLEELSAFAPESSSYSELPEKLQLFSLLCCVYVLVNAGVAGFSAYIMITGHLDFVAGSVAYAFALLLIYLAATIAGVIFLSAFFNKNPRALYIFYAFAALSTLGIVLLPLFSGSFIRAGIIAIHFNLFYWGIRYLKDSEDVSRYFGVSLMPKAPTKDRGKGRPRTAASNTDNQEWNRAENHEEDLFRA